MTILFYMKPHYRHRATGIIVIERPPLPQKPKKKQRRIKDEPQEFILYEYGKEIAKSYNLDELRAEGWKRRMEWKRRRLQQAIKLFLLDDD